MVAPPQRMRTMTIKNLQASTRVYHQHLRRLSSIPFKPFDHQSASHSLKRHRTPSRLEPPRVPVELSSRLKSISLSPLVDPRSPLSLPKSDHNRISWLNRFTPRWDESRKERLARFKQRSESMRHRRAHLRPRNS